MERLVRHDGESRDTDRLTWSRHRRISEGRASAARRGPKGLSRSRVVINGSIRHMNGRPKYGAWSSSHYGDEGAWVPLRRIKVCAGDTVGKSVSDLGRPGIVRRQGMAGIVRHSQTKGRATGTQSPARSPPRVGRNERKRNSDRCGARSSIGRGTLERDQNKRFRSPPSSRDAGWIQKTNRRGKAPYCVAASADEGLVSR